LSRFLAAVCQLAAGNDPRQAVLRAAKPGARLVVLPAFALGARGDWTAGPGPSRSELLTRAIAIARDAGCYLIPGTVLVVDDEATAGSDGPCVRQLAWLIGPDGELLGEQQQTHLTAQEEEAGWRTGSEIKVIEAPGLGCSVGLLVGLDAWIPEVSRILALGGADLLVAPMAMPRPYSEARQLAALWQEVQQNQTIGIEACLVGDRGGRSWAGRSAIIAPCEMVTDGSGFVARAATAIRGLTLYGPVDLERRREVIDSYDILGELNTGVYRQAFPDAYFADPGVAGADLDRRSPAAMAAGRRSGGPTVIGADPAPAVMAMPRLRLQEKAFRRYLTFLSRPDVIRAAVNSLGIKPRSDTGSRTRRVVRTAALQMESFYARSPKEYAVRLGEHFREALAEDVELVAFPELVTIPLIGLLPGVTDLAKSLSADQCETEAERVERTAEDQRAARSAARAVRPPDDDRAVGPVDEEALARSAQDVGDGYHGADAVPSDPLSLSALPRLADIVVFLEPVLRGVYMTFFSALAAAARVWIMAGSTPLPGPDGRIYNIAALFDPDGKLVGTQPKLHLFPRERAEGLVPGTRFEVFHTAIGAIALPICMDATYFETYRLAALLGAEIVSAPVSNLETYHYWRLLRGAWPRVQETPVYAVQSTIVGDFLGSPMTGKASIFAPAELTRNRDGILAQCPDPTGPGLAVADLDLTALAAFRTQSSSFSRLNPEIIRRYLPSAYDRCRPSDRD
jgi:predicted amidohydrolase